MTILLVVGITWLLVSLGAFVLFWAALYAGSGRLQEARARRASTSAPHQPEGVIVAAKPGTVQRAGPGAQGVGMGSAPLVYAREA